MKEELVGILEELEEDPRGESWRRPRFTLSSTSPLPPPLSVTIAYVLQSTFVWPCKERKSAHVPLLLVHPIRVN